MNHEEGIKAVRKCLSVAATEYFNELLEDIERLQGEPGAEFANKVDELTGLLGRNNIQILAALNVNKEAILKVLHNGKEIR